MEKHDVFAERSANSDCFKLQPIPRAHRWVLKPKKRVAKNNKRSSGNTYFGKIAGRKNFGLIMCPTVSDCSHFSERLIGPIPFMEG